jgi:hypothetical protein
LRQGVVSDAMAYEFHDTAHLEKRGRERGFTVEQAMLTINEPASIYKTPPQREITAASSGCSPARLAVESLLS